MGDLVLESLHLVVDSHLNLFDKVVLALLLRGKQEHDIKGSIVDILRLIEVYFEESKRNGKINAAVEVFPSLDLNVIEYFGKQSLNNFVSHCWQL